MISISRLLCNTVSPGDGLRYGDKLSRTAGLAYKHDIRPVVVWNCTRQCNLHCVHCYASADASKSENEMDNSSAEAFIDDLAEFGVPVILFSGGEPLLRKGIFNLAQHARNKNIRIALSTNGTLITEKIAKKICDTGFAEVGISLDGIGSDNDRFRGQTGAFTAALNGIRLCISSGIRVSLRLTITRFNYQNIPDIFRLVETEGIDRVCFYHLVYSGRGSTMQKDDITHPQRRTVLDTICRYTLEMYQRGLNKEVLTVGNHADGVYLYLKMQKEDSSRAAGIRELLRMNGGNNSGVKIGAVDDRGNVHPDQFWWHHSLGNVLQRKFSEIWSDASEPLLNELRNRKSLLTGRCAGCRYLDLCNGNMRIRAEAVSGNIWAPDPACYLSDREIGIE